MSLIWNDSLKTGIKDIDEQHQKLFETINQLESIYDNKEKIWDILVSLNDYANNHFNTEENYMKSLNYPDYNSHKKEHEHFRSSYNSLMLRVSRSESIYNEIPSIVKLCSEWISKHYEKTDLKMAEFIREKLSKIEQAEEQ